MEGYAVGGELVGMICGKPAQSLDLLEGFLQGKPSDSIGN